MDPLGRQQIRAVIMKLRDAGTTIFLNSHLLSEVEQVCDRVAIMHHGRILQQGTVNEITATMNARGAFMVRFATSAPSPEAQKALAALGAVTPGERGFTITLPSEREITAVIDALRSNRVEIFEVEPQRANLEEAFIGLISQQADQGVGGVH